MKPTLRPIIAPALACALAAAVAAAPAAASPDTPTHLIQVSLLVASKGGPSDLADLPANTRQAIEDIREFLPFKSYRLLDTGLVRTTRHAETKLRGPGGSEFRASVNLRTDSPPGKIVVNHFALHARRRPESSARPPAASGVAEPGEAPAAPKPSTQQVMSSSFSADVGQTVVVGTSRLNGGDEALVVLFTALPEGS